MIDHEPVSLFEASPHLTRPLLAAPPLPFLFQRRVGNCAARLRQRRGLNWCAGMPGHFSADCGYEEANPSVVVVNGFVSHDERPRRCRQQASSSASANVTVFVSAAINSARSSSQKLMAYGLLSA
jgi:hypothetical protein